MFPDIMLLYNKFINYKCVLLLMRNIIGIAMFNDISETFPEMGFKMKMRTKYKKTTYELWNTFPKKTVLKNNFYYKYKYMGLQSQV